MSCRILSERIGKTQGIRLRMRPPRNAKTMAVRVVTEAPEPATGSAPEKTAGLGTAPFSSGKEVSIAQPPAAGPPSPTKTPESVARGSCRNSGASVMRMEALPSSSVWCCGSSESFSTRSSSG